MKKASCIYMPNCILGEGCVWNEQEGMLYFADIEAGEIYSLDPERLPGAAAGGVSPGVAADGLSPAAAGGQPPVQIYRQDGRTGCMVFHQDGELIAAVTNRLVYQSLPGHQDSSVRRDPRGGEKRILLRQDFPDTIRYNDGKCDRYGNLWVGTMAVSQEWSGAKGCGSLYCIRENRVVAEYPGYTIPNGMDWNADGSIFYHIDTPLQRVDAYEVKDRIHLENRHPVIRVQEADGSPDGMCIDADGNLWVAMWGGYKVVCYETGTGKKLEEVTVPDRCVSCCCFGGRDGTSLFITTARAGDGTGGQIYRAEVGVKGAGRYRYGSENKKTGE